MNTKKSKKMLIAALDQLRRDRGDAEAQRLFEECRTEGMDAMSKEVLLLLVARYFPIKNKCVFFVTHPLLVIPVLLRLCKSKSKAQES